MKDNMKRLLAFVLAAVMLVSLCPTLGLTAAAAEPGEEEAQGETSNSYEPWKHGYRFVDVLNWSPETDNYSEELRAQVPLQERNEPFAATQANPNLKSDALVYNVAMGNYRSTDTAEAPWNGNQYYDEFNYNLFKFWQYTDFIGSGGRPTTGFDSETASEQGRYEYGVVAIPIAAFVNAAHKNGVRALGEYFIPRDPQYTEEWLYKDEDGNFPYGQKLIDLMNYYGFDGYFINQEGAFDSSLFPVFKEMMAWMREQGCYIQWYDSINDDGGVSYRNEFNSQNSHWVQDEIYGRVTDSIWLNYWWNLERIDNSVAHAEELGLDPYETVFLGIECGMGRFEGGELYSSGYCRSEATVEYLDDWYLDETGNPKMSLALWGGDFVHEAYGKTDNVRYTDGYQWISEERERMWYTSPKESVLDHSMDNVNRADVEVGEEVVWPGLSNFIAERSAINGTVFITNFNNGHGMQYFLDGEVSRDMGWSNMNLQDFMPTWQWWVESEGTALNLDWDYGPEQEKVLLDGTTGSFDYEQIGAYNGGSSLAIYGDLEAGKAQKINLYKTDLEVTADSTLSLVYNKPSADDGSTLALALIFQDAPENAVVLTVADSGKQTSGWQPVEFDLSAYAGRNIAAIGVQVLSETDVTGYQLNLGQLKLSDGQSYAPEAPEGFVVDKVFDTTGEIELAWTLNEDYDTVKLYHVYAVYADGSERFVSGAYADNLYIQNLEDRDQVVGLNLRAVGADGSESEPAFAALQTEGNVTNVRTVSRDGKLVVTWDEPEVDFDQVQVALSYWYSDRTAPASVTVDKGVKTATLDIGLEDSSRYLLTLTTTGENASTVYYFGELADNYSEPYDGEVRVHADGGRFSLTTPLAEDWTSLYLTMDGVTTTYSRHSGNKLYDIAMPEGLTLASVVVEDMNGNRSTPVTFRFQDGQLVDLDETVADEIIPDEVLRKALFEKAGGNTYGDLIALSGELDLSGLEIQDLTGMYLLVNVAELNLSGTQISDLSPLTTLTNLKKLVARDVQLTALAAGVLPANLEELDLSENSKLTQVEEGVIASLAGLKTLNLSDNTALTTLYLDNTPAMTVNVSGCTALQQLILTGTQMSDFDITGLSQLTHFYGNNSNLAMLTAGEAAEYPALDTFDLSGSKFDLSEKTPERALIDGLAEIANLKYDGQRPEIIYAELPATLEVWKNSGDIRTMDYFENIYLHSTTVRGTLYSSIVEEDWIAEDYDAAGLCAVPSNVYVEIRDEEGNYINEPEQPDDLVDVETNRALNATVLGYTAQNTGEEASMLFDGSYSSKWCTSGASGWVAFHLAEAVQVGRWVTAHAQANNEPMEYNTLDFELQVLNTEAVGMSEEEFLASDGKNDAAILGNDANWTTIAHVTDNHEAIVDQELETAAPTAQIYRLKVNMGYGDTPWGAIRFQELELYAASNVVRDYEGILSTEIPGTYQVAFKKGLQTTLNTMEVIVESAETKFQDVKTDAWYYDAVDYVASRGIMIGTSDNTFSPVAKMTRGQMITILYRLAGSPAVEGTVPFTDVKENRFFYQAVVWAYQNGIGKGTTLATFAPDSDMTREQMVTFLYRYSEMAGVDVSEKADLSSYTDASAISAYAVQAMAWAVAEGHIIGVTETRLAPRGDAIRAQVAEMIMRYLEEA